MFLSKEREMGFYKKMAFGLPFILGLLLFFAQATEAKGEIQEQIDSLKSPLPRARQEAILNLLKIRVPEIVPPILTALSDPNPYVRYTAAWALNPYSMNLPVQYDGTSASVFMDLPQLTPFNSKEIVSALVTALPESDYWVRQEMLETLEKIQIHQQKKGLSLSEQARQTVLTLFEDPDPDIRAGAAQNMRLWKGDSAIEAALRQAFTNDVWRVRLSAVSHLRDDWNILSEALQDPRFELRFWVVEFLRKDEKNDPRKIDLLIQALQDPSLQIVFPAIKVLVSTKSDKAIIPLLLLEERLQRYAPGIDIIGEAITKITGQPLEAIRKAYQAKMHQFILKTKPIKTPEIDTLTRKLQSGQPSEIIFAIKEIPWHQSEYKALLLEGVKTNNTRLRFSFLNELSTYIARYYIIAEEFETIFQSLTEAAEDSNPHVRRMALNGLTNFLYEHDAKKFRVIAYLTRVYREEKDPFVTKNRILYFGHIWGTDPETVILAPEFRK